MKLQQALYNVLIPVAAAGARLAAPFNAKIAEGLKGRGGLRERWISGAAGIDRRKRLLWFHVSSVGEFLQAKPVISLLAERSGGTLGVALTFFSPSGMNYFKNSDRTSSDLSVGFLDYLPLDKPGNARFCLDTLKPDGIVYVKFDLWPNLLIEASQRGIPQVLISGTLAPSSRRLSRLVRGFYGSLYSRLEAIAAISDEDAERFRMFSSGALEVCTAGDTRFDQVCRRIDNPSSRLPEALFAGKHNFIIAGSTWPRDEEVVVPGFRSILAEMPEAQLILAPHEPTPARLAEIGRLLNRTGLPFKRLSELEPGTAADLPVILADGVGYLAEIYRAGRIAYVGGSFTTGVHNVMEPAGLGLPVLHGPRIDNSYEARKLVELGSGRIVRTGDDFSREATRFLRDDEALNEAGEKGSRFVRKHCGAALRCVDLIEKHILAKGRQ